MDRILIFGRSGAGKSTLANRLGGRFGLPVFHLDKLFWLPGWVERDKGEMAVDVEKILTDCPRWVIDGNYRKAALESRIRAADLVIVLNYSFPNCVWRVIKRNITHWGKSRPDMQNDCVERFNFELLKYIWSYPTRTLGPIESVLARFPEKAVKRFRGQGELDRWLRTDIR